MMLKGIRPLAGVVLLAAASLLGQSAANRGTQAKAAPNAAVVHGKQVYEAQCAICHFSSSTKKKIGPGLKGLMARGKFSDGKKVDEESLRVWIEKGGKDMPGFKDSLNETEIRDLIAYLKTL